MRRADLKIYWHDHRRHHLSRPHTAGLVGFETLANWLNALQIEAPFTLSSVNGPFLALVHAGEYEDYEAWEKEADDAQKRYVVLVSSEGESGHRDRPPGVVALSEPLQDFMKHISQTEAEWFASTIRAGDPDWTFFEERTLELMHVPVLALLCQGYLAVHSDPDSDAEPEVDSAEIASCKDALHIMGWTALRARRKEASERNRAVAPLFADRATLKGEVVSSTWDGWKAFTNPEVDWRGKSKEEWQKGAPEAKSEWHLVEALFDQIGPAQTPVTPGVVARAYIAVAANLGNADALKMIGSL